MPDDIIELMPNDWQVAIENCVGQVKWQKIVNNLNDFLQKEHVDRRRYHPTGRNIFKAFEKTPFDSVRFVIIGQDPYPDENKATGLAFSMPPNLIHPNPTALSSSIESIYAAIEYDNVEFTRPNHGNLEPWADQGVLLLNRVLTFHKCVGCNKNIHKNKGWEQFTQAVVKTLSKDNTRQFHFILWGNDAQDIKTHINGYRYHIHAAPHPTSHEPYREAFRTCRHFSAVNAILSARIIAMEVAEEEPIQGINYDPIVWHLPEAPDND